MAMAKAIVKSSPTISSIRNEKGQTMKNKYIETTKEDKTMEKLTKRKIVSGIVCIMMIIAIIACILNIDGTESKAWVNGILERNAWERYREENRKLICKQISQKDELILECVYQYPSKDEFDKIFFKTTTKDKQ